MDFLPIAEFAWLIFTANCRQVIDANVIEFIQNLNFMLKSDEMKPFSKWKKKNLEFFCFYPTKIPLSLQRLLSFA